MQMLARIKLRTIRPVSTEITATCFKLQKLLPTLPEYLKQYFLFSSGLKQISYKSFEESEINSTEKVVPFQNAIIFGIRKLWHSALTFHIQPAETHIRMPELSAPEKIFCISAQPLVYNVYNVYTLICRKGKHCAGSVPSQYSSVQGWTEWQKK